MFRMILAFLIICLALYFGLRYIVSLNGAELEDFIVLVKNISIILGLGISVVCLILVLF